MMDETILKVVRGDATTLEERRVTRWRGESADHERRFRELEAIWTATTPAPRTSEARTPPSVEYIVAQAETLKRREARERLRGRLLRRVGLPLALAAAAAAVALGTGRLYLGPPPDVGGTEYVAGANEPATATFEDGSFVRLDAGGRVRFTATDGRRDAWLSGRGFFGVRSDAARPFSVHTDLGEIQVLGTRFEVAQREQGLRVVVVEGRVSVATVDGDQRVEAGKGQVVELAPNGDFSVRTVDDVYDLLDWAGGLLLFQGTPVAQVAQEVGARFDVTVTVAPELADRTVTVWFGDEPLEEVVTSICLLVQAECVVEPGFVRMGG